MESDTNNKKRLVQFRVSGQEGVMLDQLLSRFGSMTSEYMRSLIREKHAKVFPAYTVKGKEKVLESTPELTQGQICEMFGGKIEMVNGVEMCVRKIGASMQSKVPLSIMGTGDFTIEKLRKQTKK